MSGKRVPVLTCDGCGDQLLDVHPRTSTLQQARSEARDRGWSSSRAGGRTRDYCQKCWP